MSKKNTQTELQNLREEKAEFATFLKEWNDGAEAGKTYSADDLAKYDEVESKYNEITARIETLERSERIAELLNSKSAPKIGPTKKIQSYDAGDAFKAWALYGVSDVKDSWKRSADRFGVDFTSNIYAEFAQSSDVNGEGGYNKAGSILQAVVDAQKAYGGVVSICETINTDANYAVNFSTVDDTATVAAAQAQNSTVAQTGLTYGQVSLSAYDYDSGVYPISLSLIQDAQYDLVAHVGKVLGTRLARGIAADTVSGNGSGKITGLMTQTTSGSSGVHAALVEADLLDLFFSVDPALRNSPSCKWIMSDLSLNHLMSVLKDSVQRPTWGPGLDGSPTSSLLGKQVVIVPEMDTPLTASKKPIAFGDFSAYKYRTVGGPQIIRNPVASKFAVEFLAVQRADGKLVDAGDHPIKHLATT